MEDELRISVQQFRTEIRIIRLKLEDGLAKLPLFVFSRGSDKQKLANGVVHDKANKIIAEGFGRNNEKFVIEATPAVGLIPGELAYKLDRYVDQLLQSNVVENVLINGACRKVLFFESCAKIAHSIGSGYRARDISGALRQLASVTYQESREVLHDGNIREDSITFHKFQLAERKDLSRNTTPNEYSSQKGIALIFDDAYLAFLADKILRPINSKYLLETKMPGLSARFYEIVSKKIFTAIKFHQPTAQFSYNEFCRIAPQKQNNTLSDAKKQMAKIVGIHLENGYLKSFVVEKCCGKLDFNMVLTPGPLAYEEYNFFNQSAKRELPDSQFELIEDLREGGAGSNAEQSDVVTVESRPIEAPRMAQVESKSINPNQPHPQDIKAGQAQPQTLTGEVEALLIKEGVRHGSKKLREILKRVSSGELTRSVVEELIGYCRWAKQTGFITKGYAGFLVAACEAGPSFISDEYRAGRGGAMTASQSTSAAQQQAEAKEQINLENEYAKDMAAFATRMRETMDQVKLAELKDQVLNSIGNMRGKISENSFNTSVESLLESKIATENNFPEFDVWKRQRLAKKVARPPT